MDISQPDSKTSQMLPVLQVTPGESSEFRLTYDDLRKYVSKNQAKQIHELYSPSAEELGKYLGTDNELTILSTKLKGQKFANTPFDELTLTKTGSIKGKAYLQEMNHVGIGPACAVARLNLLPKIMGNTNSFNKAYPIQQQQLIQILNAYISKPRMLPWLGTETGRAPKREQRDWIAAVLQVVIANTCFYTWRIGRYHSSGEFIDLSVLELAREGGFTKKETTPKLGKDGQPIPGEFTSKEIIERPFLRAWDAVRQSYIESYQPKLSPNADAESGWHRSYKILNPKLVHHIRKWAPPRFMPNAQFADLVKIAKKRVFKAERKSRANRIKDFEQSKLKTPELRQLVAKLNEQRQKFAKDLIRKGHLAAAALEFAILRFSLSHSVLSPGKKQFGKPS